MDSNQTKCSVLSGLVMKNKMGHLGGATLGGAVMYGGSKLIEHINIKQEKPYDLIEKNKKEMAILLTGIGIVVLVLPLCVMGKQEEQKSNNF